MDVSHALLISMQSIILSISQTNIVFARVRPLSVGRDDVLANRVDDEIMKILGIVLDEGQSATLLVVLPSAAIVSKRKRSNLDRCFELLHGARKALRVW